jgi:recombination DNA repair RAD52 pathway protein
MPDKGAALEKAKKEAVTDARKRFLSTYLKSTTSDSPPSFYTSSS